MWEKHEPRSLDEYIGRKDLVQKLNEFIANDSLPHLIFSGPAGTGKTLLANLVAKKYLGKELHLLEEYNGSSERGIDEIRRINMKLDMVVGNRKKKYMFIIDEAEELTTNAWKAMKVILTRFKDRAIFIMITNHPNKIPTTIESRAYFENFDPYPFDSMWKMVKRVMKSEGIEITQKRKRILEIIVKLSHGDMRRLFETFLVDFVRNPDMQVEDLPGGKVEKVVAFVSRLKDKIEGKPEFVRIKTVMKVISKLLNKISRKDVVLGFVQGFEDIDLAIFAGEVLHWIQDGVPEEVAFLSFAAKVAKIEI